MSPGSRRIFGIALALAAGLLGSWAAQDDPEPAAPEPRWVPPGTAGYPPELDRRLTEALAARGDGYRPRTHHFRSDGAPRYTNRLIFESSPYLLQHAHNPVDWYPWGDEAFATARRLGRPVLLSIGYSTCHWCHVMEEESFEDEEIAAYLNEHYVAIKVDREERPDLDDIYMTAVQLLTGRGGWPMTTWLTPDRLPFYGGTYFPARDGDRGRSTGFLTLLKRLREIYDQDPDKVASQATTIRDRILARQGATAGDLPSLQAIEMAVAGYSRAFDDEHGGIGRAPKFPSSLPIRLLLRHYRRSGDAEALDMALLTLDRMAAGGMYDQVGGGFHRYSTDRRWLVPHFEKMLYDNALLAVAYLDAFQVTGEERFSVVVRDVLDYVAREMTSPAGGFYSATDADSLAPNGEREEGWFFTWTPDELRAELGDTRARPFIAYYGVTDEGDYEGRNILHVTRTLDEVAASLEISSAELDRELEAAREILYRTRSSRPAPLRDDKVLVSWNGLMVSAFARAGFVLGRDDYVKRAEEAAEFLLEHLVVEGRLRRSYNEGRARHNAYLDDYAFLVAGLLDLYETTHRLRWLERAIALQATLDEHYLDKKAGGYFLTSDDHEELLSRDKPTYDGAEPSGNALALMNLLRLYELTTNAAYLSTAEAALKAFGRTIASSPRGVSEMLLALDFYLDRSKEIVLVTRGSTGAEPFLDVLRQTFAPNKVVIVVREGEDLKRQSTVVPLVAGKVARGGQPTAYVCEQGVCKLPTTDPQEFARQLIEPAMDSIESSVESGER